MLGYYRDEVDDNIVKSKDLNSTTIPETSAVPSLIEKVQENQEELIQRNKSESVEFPLFAHDFVLEEIFHVTVIIRTTI